MKIVWILWCFVYGTGITHGTVFKPDAKSYPLTTCPERAVCSEITEDESENGENILFSTDMCECPSGHTCPKEPNDQTIAVNKGKWYGVCQPIAELPTCKPGDIAEELLLSPAAYELDYKRVNCICPAAKDGEVDGWVTEFSNMEESAPEAEEIYQSSCAADIDKRGGRLSSFYKRAIPGLSSFYKRGRYGNSDKNGRFYFYKRGSDDGLGEDIEGEVDKRGRYGSKPDKNKFYFYKRGRDGISSFYKRYFGGDNLSSFYKRGRYGSSQDGLSSFYKRRMDGLSSFYKRGINGMSSFYKRDNEAVDGDLAENEKRGRYGSSRGNSGKFYFYKRGGRYGQNDSKGRFYFYKRGGRYGSGRDRQKFYFY